MKIEYGTEKTNAVAYIGTSLAEDDGSSQEKRISEYCINEGIELAAVFKDVDKSGLHLNRGRLKKLFIYIDEVKNKVNQIMVAGIDRK